MTSILISSDDLSLGERVAEAVAKDRNMPYINRSLLDDIAPKYGVKSRNLRQLLDSTGRFKTNQKHLLACLQVGVLERLLDDNIVCTGLGAHLYVQGVSHVLNIRVLSDMASVTHRLAAEKNMTPKKVRAKLEKKTRLRQAYTLAAFGIDETHPSNYDMLFTLGKFDIEQVVKTIVETADERKFQAMTYSHKCALDLVIAGRVQLALDRFSNVGIRVNDGTATLSISKGFGWKRRAEALRTKTMDVEGVADVRIRLNGHRESDNGKRTGNTIAQ